MEMSGQLHVPAALPQGKSPWYPLDRKLGGPQNRSGQRGVEKNSQPLSGLETPIIQAVGQRYTNGAIPAPRSMAMVSQITITYTGRHVGIPKF
jgi:hypothetical protein